MRVGWLIACGGLPCTAAHDKGESFIQICDGPGTRVYAGGNPA